MASNIVSTTIDATFPTPGVDNDTQGFRDNFGIIKENFAAAKAEIDVLQDYTAKLDKDNNFDGNSIIFAKFQKSGDVFVSPTNDINNSNDIVNGNYEVQWATAPYHAYNVSGDALTIGQTTPTHTLEMMLWPATNLGILGKMVIQITATVDSRIVEFTSTNGSIDGIIKLPAGVNNPVTLAIGTTNIYEFWTMDGGTTVYGRLLGSYT
jgi:hypothetical protein